MSDVDVLEDLERELGPSLRVALGRAAAEITGEPGPDRRDGLDGEGPVASVVDIRSTGAPRTRRRHWLVVAAASAAAIVITVAALVEGVGDPGIRTTGPAGSGPSAPAPAPTGHPGLDALMRSEGTTPSTPKTSKLVVSAWFGGDLGAYVLFADGRLLWLDDLTGTPGWVEQRLTPEGVERVRSEFLATGLFDDRLLEGNDPGDAPCGAVFAVLCVRDDGRILSRSAALSGPGTGAAAPPGSPEEQRLRDHLRMLPWSLPATDWVDPQPTAYVPARYQVCLQGQDAGSAPRFTVKESIVLKALPVRAAKILRRSEADPSSSFGTGSCFVVPTGKGRLLASELVDALGAPDPVSIAEYSFDITADVNRSNLKTVRVRFTQLLPNGDGASYYRDWA